LKVSLHSYEQKYLDCTRELNSIFKTGVKDTDPVRFDSQIEAMSELLEAEQENVHLINEEIEEFEVCEK
jgi:hypothetical protein